MASKAVLLLEHAPKFTAKGGLFYVDFGTEGIPAVALSPSIMLKAIAKARSEYERWDTDARRREPPGLHD